MHKLNRNDFLKLSLKTGALLLAGNVLAGTPDNPPSVTDKALMQRLVTTNDALVEQLLQTDFTHRDFSRKLGYDINLLTASYSYPASRYYQNSQLLSAIDALLNHLIKAQAPDGTINVGNLESPPDTGFIVEIVTASATVLHHNKAEALQAINQKLKTFLQKAGDALAVGGVHTPNHRWVISAALARINELYPHPKYVARINAWLAEGVYINSDGNYPERSRIYNNVESTAFLTIGRLQNKPNLLQVVAKNLMATYYYSEPNGELVANDSRRQDQYSWKQADPNSPLTILYYYPLYRYLAIHQNNRFFAAVTKFIEGLKGFEDKVLSRGLIQFLEEPLLQKELPPTTTLPVNFEKFFTQSNLLRVRRSETTITLFGGADLPITVASGRSNSPDFFGYRKGDALLKYMRLSAAFFSTGYFYSEGIKKEGNRYVLHSKLNVPYYQPLPKSLRNASGDYKLSESVDGRFWNKMDFKNRPVSNVKTLDTTIAFTENKGVVELAFDVKGQPGVPVTLELCFKEGGTLTGVTAAGDGQFFVDEGKNAEYAFGNDTITIGPGAHAHTQVTKLEGERYSTHFGNLHTEGMMVYLTGITPFVHRLRIG